MDHRQGMLDSKTPDNHRNNWEVRKKTEEFQRWMVQQDTNRYSLEDHKMTEELQYYLILQDTNKSSHN